MYSKETLSEHVIRYSVCALPSPPLRVCCVYVVEVLCDQTCLDNADLKEGFNIDSASPGTC